MRALAVHGMCYADNVCDRSRYATIQGIVAELLVLATRATLDSFDPLRNSIMLHPTPLVGGDGYESGETMNFLRLHWFDLDIVLAVIAGVYVALSKPAALPLLLWLNLIALFLQQTEEYRWPGYFPGMINTVMYASSKPDRYPLNTNTAMLVNVVVGWVSYLLIDQIQDNFIAYFGLFGALPGMSFLEQDVT